MISKPVEKYFPDGSNNVIESKIMAMNELICPLFKDMDPSQEIEDEYKHKHD